MAPSHPRADTPRLAGTVGRRDPHSGPKVKAPFNLTSGPQPECEEPGNKRPEAPPLVAQKTQDETTAEPGLEALPVRAG